MFYFDNLVDMRLIYMHYNTFTEEALFETEHWDMLVFTKYDIEEAWMKYWGSFLSSLWEALVHADMNNAHKLIDTWNNYIKDYFNQNLLTCKLIENND